MASQLRRSRDQEVLPLAAAGLRHAALLLPVVVILLTSLVLTDYCHQLLATAGQAAPVLVDRLTVSLVLGAFLLAAAALVVVQAARVAARVDGPERRLVDALRRMRDGDLTFRVHLRRGDPLGGVARECNELLDWLNAHPPVGARVGGDIVDVEDDRVAEVAP